MNEVQGSFRRVTDVENGDKYWVNLDHIESLQTNSNGNTDVWFSSGGNDLLVESISLLVEPCSYAKIGEDWSDDKVDVSYFYERCSWYGFILAAHPPVGTFATKEQAIRQAHEDGFWVVNA